jgi:hypothetical protein
MLVEMVVKSMETAEEATASMEMAPGELSHPGRVPEQRLLSSYMTSSRKTPIDLGFFVRRLFIGREAASEGHQGGLTTPW